MIDLEKRRRVMARSMQLGHCICDPKKGCPCDVFKEKNVCPCAGERLEQDRGPVRLTQMVERPGCASKIDAASLRRVLKSLPAIDDPRVLIGMPAGDDAGVYRLDDESALVQTVDVFAPSVDDPYLFGQVAAANSVSDIYAMGGRPLTALSIVGFPIRSIADDVLEAILRGGIDKMNEAGVAVIGGHSINEQEIKAGFAVTGLIDPRRVVSNAGLAPGDRLILTKPLGTGILAFAGQIGRAPDGSLDAAAQAMARLNRRAAELMQEYASHGCTDVTGFGLAGHLSNMAAASRVDVEVVWDDLPLLPGVLECLAAGIVSGAVERNRESSEKSLDPGDNVTPAMLDLCFDAQTSGGLLIAVAEADAELFLRRLHEEGIAEAAMIGHVRGPGSGRVAVRTTGARRLVLQDAAVAQPVPKEPAPVEAAACCCPEGGAACSEEGPPDAVEEAGTDSPACCAPAVEAADISAIETQFQSFMQAASAPGALDARTKKAIAIALSVLSKCEPCVKSHIKSARKMGFAQEEIDEAAWLAIAFGGAPLMMFYKPLRRTA